jgi:uncharacterized damage-inducible protein DinB
MILRPSVIAFLLTFSTLVSSQSLSAQNSIADELRREWANSRRQMVALAEAMPADKYGYKATPEVRSFGEILTHVAGEGRMEMEAVAGAQLGSSERYASLRDRAEIVRALSEVFDYGAGVLANMTDQQALASATLRQRQSPRWVIVMGVIGHNKEHYGNLVTYLRLNNIVPPASQ